MNKHLLLALLFIPLVVGCENSAEAESSPAADIAAVIPGIQWEVHNLTCKIDSGAISTDSEEPDSQVIATGIDWEPVSIGGTRSYFNEDTGQTVIVGLESGWNVISLNQDGTVEIWMCNAGDAITLVLGY